MAFNRISDEPIRVRAAILEPDVMVVLDSGLLDIIDVTSRLHKGGTLVINTKKKPDEVKSRFRSDLRVAMIDASRIARQILGVPIVNTTMLGALLRATAVVKLESLREPLRHRFGRIAEKNIEACKTAYEKSLVMEG